MYRKCLLGKKTSSWPRRWFLRDNENIFIISKAMKYFYRTQAAFGVNLGLNMQQSQQILHYFVFCVF